MVVISRCFLSCILQCFLLLPATRCRISSKAIMAMALAFMPCLSLRLWAQLLDFHQTPLFLSPSTYPRDPGQGVQQPQQQQQQQQQPAAQRQIVVRRFQIAFQLDLLLILKLAAVIFLFNQEGSRQRLIILVILASLVYFYQTGVLAPLVRWLSQSMQRAAAPPHPLRPAVRAENPPGAARQNENVAFAEGHVGAENVNPPAEDANQAGENVAEAGGENAVNHWWGIVKEIQMIVFSFITSLLPGFHNMD